MVASPSQWLSRIIPVSARDDNTLTPQPVRQTVYALPTIPTAPVPISSKPISLRGPQPKEIVGPKTSRPSTTSVGNPQPLGGAYPFGGGVITTGPTSAVGSHWYSGSPTGVGGGYYGRV
jgi:hypothetical protein